MPLTPEAERMLVKKLREFTDSETAALSLDQKDVEMEQVAIQRMVPKRKGNWWLLPKDLKVEGDDFEVAAKSKPPDA